MTTYYKINGQYISYQQAHDLGYTMEATADQDYKSAGSNDWGEASGSGFYDGLDGDLVSGSFFIEGEIGWYNINALAIRGYFPAEADTLVMHNVLDGRVSDAAELEVNGENYYLVQADLNLGWISEDDLPETGWQEGSLAAAFCGNFTTGDEITTDSVDGGQGYLQRSLVFKNFIQLIGWNEGGNVVKNNHPKSLNALVGWEEGGNFGEGEASVEVLLGLRWDGQAWLQKTFGANDYWWSGLLSNDDKTLIESIGLQSYVIPSYHWGGTIGTILYDPNYVYTILGLYSDLGGTQEVQADLSNFYCAPKYTDGDNYLCIWSINAFSDSSLTWMLKATKIIGGSVLRLYLRSSSYQTANKSVAANSANNLYAQGSDGMYTISDLTRKFALKSAYTNAGVSVDISGCALSVLATGRVSLYWGGSAANVCYIEAITNGEQIIAYKADGTTSQGIMNGNEFVVNAVDYNFHSEAELNALGWYVRWNLYTFASPVSAINIRNTPSLSTSTVIAVWPAGTTLVGNPYLEQTVDGRVWQTVKFSLDDGTTIQTGYCIVDSQVPVTHTTGIAQTDVLLAVSS